ncbi:hypothetical protein niasHT_037707 [Heterodera trifolii]|uniref:Uncharacterized protein n=1 Tax=Heterodera trifolii TaxID=157864 RepID=A0ABD2J497_9BILA
MRWSFFLQYRLTTTTTTTIIIISSVLALLVGKLQCCHPEGAGGAGAGTGTAGGAGGTTAAGGTAASSGGVASADTANAVAASAAAGGPCVACTTDTLAVLNLANANAAGLTAGGTSAPTSTPAMDASGCRVVTPTCPNNEVLLISVPVGAGTTATDFEVYNSGALTLVCNAQTQWLEMNGNRAGSVVNGYACVAPVVPPGAIMNGETTVAVTTTMATAPTAAPAVAASVAASVASVAAAAGGGSSCTACSSATNLAVLSTTDVAALITNARLAEEPINQVSTSDGCTTLTPTCPTGEAVVIRVIQENNVPILEAYGSLQITFICNAQTQWLSLNGVRNGRPVTGYACVTQTLAGGAGAAFAPVTSDASAAASAAAGRCTGCNPNLARVLVNEVNTNNNAANPKGVNLCEAIAVSAVPGGVITAPNNCQVLPLICSENEVAVVHVILKNGDVDYGVYPATAANHIELDCNSQGVWLVPLTAPVPRLQHPGLQVDRYSCVASDREAAERRRLSGITDCNVRF